MSPEGPGSTWCFVLPPPETYSPTTGGAIATVVRNLARELAARERRVVVAAPDDGTGHYDEGEVAALGFDPGATRPWPVRQAHRVEGRLRRWAWPDYRPYLAQVRRVLAEHRPDVLVAANDPDLLPALGPEAGPLPVLWLHNLLEGSQARAMAALPESCRLVAVSGAVARWTEARYHLPPGRVAVVPNGVDATTFSPRPDFASPRPGPLRVVCHGRVAPNKGPDVALEAVRRLRADGVDVTLTLAGPVRVWGSAMPDAERWAADLRAGVEAAGGTWTGGLPPAEVPALLAGHDVGCALSRVAEPFSLAALEAMASGLALVATAVGGLVEVVGEAGWMVEPDDPGAVAEALGRMAADPALLAERKRAARNRAETMSWAVSVDTLLALLGG